MTAYTRKQSARSRMRYDDHAFRERPALRYRQRPVTPRRDSDDIGDIVIVILCVLVLVAIATGLLS